MIYYRFEMALLLRFFRPPFATIKLTHWGEMAIFNPSFVAIFVHARYVTGMHK
jgi:hypothetical protein